MKSQLAALAALAVLSQPVSAVVLLAYSFENPAGSATFTTSATTSEDGVSGSAFGSVGDDDADGVDGSTFTSDTAGRSIFEFTNTTGITVGSAPYWNFTITSSQPLSLETLTFAIGKAGSNAGTASYNVSSGVDGHTTLFAATNFTYSGDAGAMSAPANQSIDLSAAAFQNLDASGGVEFRIYYAESSTDTNTGARIDSVSLNGEVVPEPSTAMLLGVMLSAAMLRRRR